MKVAIINYYLRMNDYPTKYSLSALRLGEYLSSVGIEVDIVPVSLIDLDFEKFVKENIDGKYDIVGISHYVWSKKATPKIAKIIRDNAPNVSTIIGGPEVKYVDLSEYENEIFILGEGEISLQETVNYIANGKNDEHFFENNPNVFDKEHPECSMTEEKLVYKNPLFTRFNNIDTDFLYYETSRGCAYSCGYCGFRNREKIENFDLDFVEEEIKRIGRIGFKEVFVVDANLGGTPIRAKSILRMFNMYAPGAKLTIYLRPEFVDDEMIELLDAANLKEVRIGIQTVNERIPAWIRSNSLSSITEDLPKLHTKNIPWKAEFIIGLPGDDFEGLKKSLDFAENVLQPTEICCYPLTLIKDTPMFNLVDSDQQEWIKMDENYRAYESYTYTHEELVRMQAYAVSRMNSYLQRAQNIDDTNRISKINRNKIIYKDVR